MKKHQLNRLWDRMYLKFRSIRYCYTSLHNTVGCPTGMRGIFRGERAQWEGQGGGGVTSPL